MSTTTEELKKLYKKLGGSENTTRAASTPAEVLNGINELDFGFDTDGDLKLAGENSDIILTDDENTWDGTNKSLKDALAAASVDHIEFNPDEPATEDLEKLKGNGVVYGIPKFAISKEAEGNPITFADGADAPLVECGVEFEAQQDLHGYEKPWVGGAGKNKFSGVITSSTMSYSDGVITNTNTDSRTDFRPVIRLFKNGTRVYTDSFGIITSKGKYIHILNISQDFDTLVFGHSGSTRDLIFSYTFANAPFAISYYLDGFDTSTVGGLVLKEFQIELGTTATTFEPYSNICPISGYSDIEVNVRGFNIFDEEFEQGGYNSTTGAKEASGASTYRNKNIIPVSPNRAYYFYCDTPIEQGDSLSIMVCEYDISGNYIGCFYKYTYDFSFTTGTKTRYINFRNYNGTRYTSVSDVGNTCINLSDASKNGTYEPYNPNSKDYTISLGSTRYGGTLDVVRGVLVVTHGYVLLNSADMNNSEDYPGFKNQNWLTDFVGTGANETIYSGFISNVGDEISVNTINPNRTLFFNKSVYKMTQTQWIALAQDIEICYELATPLTIQLTPTQVKSLLGNNTIFTDGKTLSIEYITKGASTIVKLIKALMPKANPAGDATDTLNKLEVDGTVYSLPSGGGGGNTVLAQSLNTLTVTEV